MSGHAVLVEESELYVEVIDAGEEGVLFHIEHGPDGGQGHHTVQFPIKVNTLVRGLMMASPDFVQGMAEIMQRSILSALGPGDD